jgi:hypothetical protein
MLDAVLDEPPREDAEELHLCAYNAAFYELGLKWHWDRATWQALHAYAKGKDCVRVYLEARQPHLLTAYDANFLIGAIQTAKDRCFHNLVAAGTRDASRINWAAIQHEEVGV